MDIAAMQWAQIIGFIVEKYALRPTREKDGIEFEGRLKTYSLVGQFLVGAWYNG